MQARSKSYEVLQAMRAHSERSIREQQAGTSSLGRGRLPAIGHFRRQSASAMIDRLDCCCAIVDYRIAPGSWATQLWCRRRAMTAGIAARFS